MIVDYKRWVNVFMSIYRQARKLNEINAAYIAGIVDGEGTITLSRRNSNKNRSVMLSIANSELALLLYIQGVMGVGKIVTKHAYKANHSQAYTLLVSNRQALDIIRMICPFLRTYKRDRAKLVLKDYIRLTPRNGKYPDRLLEMREHFVRKFFSVLPLTTKTR